MIFSNCNWGYEGSLVNVEVDLRRGIPAVDIVGLADNAVKESRERVRTAIKNSGFEFPPERVLISLSPADLRKDGAQFDLPIALAILDRSLNLNKDTKVIVLGELDLSGSVRPVRGVFAALENAISCGIEHAIIPTNCEAVPDGIFVHKVTTLEEAISVYSSIGLQVADNGWGPESDDYENLNVSFSDIFEVSYIDKIKDHNDAKFAMAVAAAGRHNLLFIGSPGCGKTMLLQNMPDITPNLLNEEKSSVQRIWSIAGVLSKDGKMIVRPFRIPHQTASIEGICGGGPNCRPGEITLANKGALFLDEAAEFRSSVLQMLRVPLETNTITLSRAGRCTTFPADFQLLMATNPCPCGNYGNPEKICLCSAKSIDMYWKKFSAPLLDRIEIVYNFGSEKNEREPLSRERIRFLVERAWKRQYKRQGHLNNHLSPEEIGMYCQLTRKAQETLDKAINRYGLSPRAISNLLKVARTVHDMLDEKEQDVIDDIETALSLRARCEPYM